MGKIVLSGRGRRWIERGHPWIYADDVAQGEGDMGELLPVFDPNSRPLGWGMFSSHSKIAVRLVTRSKEQPNRAFWLARVQRAIDACARLGLLGEKDACRLIAGDSEGLPGMIVDRYADVLVLQSGCQGSDRMRDFLLELVEECLPFQARAIYDRSDTSVRRLENLEPRTEWLRGEASEPIEVVEESEPGVPAMAYEVSVTEGHKTGHYLDQRLNRRVAARHATGARVLDVFSYDGLFGVRAALAGAKSVVCLDQSAACEERVLRNAERNGVADRLRFEKANAMQDLRRREAEGERYELVICDPPAFARNRREAEGAARGYREMNRRAIGLVELGGTLVSASCSYNVKRADFVQYLAQAAFLAGRDAWMERMDQASPDHPALLALPESDYLKCATLRL